jgi:hypothetical protein
MGVIKCKTSVTKIKKDFPKWHITKGIDDILKEILVAVQTV